MNIMSNDAAKLISSRSSRLVYRKPALVAYGMIADFTAGGSGTVQETANCNIGTPNPTRQTKC